MSGSRDYTQLTKQLEQFNHTVTLIKRTINSDFRIIVILEDESEAIILRSVKRCNELAQEIRDKFRLGKFAQGQNLRVSKLNRDFQTLLTTFTTLVEKYERSKEQELESQRRTYRQSISQARSKASRDTEPNKKQIKDDQSEQDPRNKIEMIEVNQDMLLQGQMIQEKAKELLAIKNQMENVLNIQNEIAGLINNQGKQLDIAQDNIDDANKNVKEAGSNLKDAKEHHKSASRKKMIIMGIVVVVLLIIIVPILVKFT